MKVFDSATGALLHVLVHPDPRPEDKFGWSVAISGTRVVVGAHGDDTVDSDVGSAFVYDLAGANPAEPVATLNNPTPASTDYFGWSVAISGTRVLVGAYNDDTGAVNAGSAYVYDLAGANPAEPMATLNHPAPVSGDEFGYSVAITGTRLVIGARKGDTGATDAGSAYVYDLAGENPAQPLVTLINPAPVKGDQFGCSVAIYGPRVVVGAQYDDTGGTDAGSAYVYDLGGVDPAQPAVTLNNPHRASGEYFGNSVAISGTRVLAAAYGRAGMSGSAYVYDLEGADPSQPVVTLNNPTPASTDNFGWSVAISGTQLVIGAPYDDAGAINAGSAYVYDLAGASPEQPVATLNDPGPKAGDNFGWSVAISGVRMVVGAYSGDTGAEDVGSVYVYDLEGVNPAQPEVTLKKPAPVSRDRFGNSVAISGTWVVAGAPYDDAGTVDAGSAYVYDLEGVDPERPVITLKNPTPGLGDAFGYSVAISGTRAVVGAPHDDTGVADAGSAYVYDLEGMDPARPVITLKNPTPGLIDAFGYSVAISGTRLVVGVPYADAGPRNTGIAYVYDLAGATPDQPIATLKNPTPAASDNFGQSVAISGTRVVIGAPYDDTGAVDAGSAYVYDLAGENPEQPVATLNNPAPEANDQFGHAVAISGTRAVVGALYDDTRAQNAGSAYVYDLAGENPEQPVATLNSPRPAMGDWFGYSVAIDGTTAVAGVPNDDFVMADKGAVYVFGPASSPSVLTNVATDVTITGATLNGTVNPNGADTTYSFEYRVANTSEPKIPVPANTETLQGATPVAVSAAISGLLPDTEYEFCLTATNSEGTVTAGPQNFTTLRDTIAPVITAPPGGFTPLTLLNGPAALPDYRPQAIATDNVGVTSFIQIPLPGETLAIGEHTITLRASDAAGNFRTWAIPVTVVRPAGVAYAMLYEKGGAVLRVGSEPRIQEGATWTTVVSPAVSESGAVAYLGKWKAPAGEGLRPQTGSGIFVDDRLIAKIGDPVPGITGATFQSLKAPVIDGDGRVAFIGTIKGAGVSKATDSVVVSAGRTGTLEMIAREGDAAPNAGNARYHSFTSVSLQGSGGSGTVFLATLRKGSGKPAVTPANDRGAWWQPSGKEDVQILVREGDPGWSDGERIKTFQILNSLGGSAGHGRGQIDGASALIQVGLSTRRQAQVLATPGSLSVIAMTGDLLGGTALPDAAWARMNLPSSGNGGASISVLGKLETGVGGVVKANSKGIFTSHDSGATWEPLATTGMVAPSIDGVATFSGLKDPVNSPTGAGVAFIGTVKGGSVKPRTNTGIWWRPEGGSLTLVARKGFQPPGSPEGSQWEMFKSLALPGSDPGPLFTATLKRGPGEITAKSDLALYGTDAAGTVVELIRENQPLLDKTVKTFHVLRAVSGSAGTTRSFNSAGKAVVQVTFTDRSTAIVAIQLP